MRSSSQTKGACESLLSYRKNTSTLFQTGCLHRTEQRQAQKAYILCQQHTIARRRQAGRAQSAIFFCFQFPVLVCGIVEDISCYIDIRFGKLDEIDVNARRRAKPPRSCTRGRTIRRGRHRLLRYQSRMDQDIAELANTIVVELESSHFTSDYIMVERSIATLCNGWYGIWQWLDYCRIN